MSARLAAVAIAVAVGPGVAAAQSRGLDHGAHAEIVAAKSGVEPVACAGCHPGDSAGRLRGRPDHATCFSTCHAPMPPRRTRQPYAVADDRRPLCLVCHAASALDAAARGERAKMTVAAPPPERADFVLSMSHAGHAASACESCHRFGPKSRQASRPHDRCRNCHTKRPVSAALSMSACDRCHRPAANRKPLASEPSPYSTRARFSHAKHRDRIDEPKDAVRRGQPATATSGNNTCLTCHAGVDELEGPAVPRPTKATCVNCHDSTAAFSTTEPRCRDCHQGAPIPAGIRRRQPARFHHDVHSGPGSSTGAACTACHPAGGGFDPTVGHTLCAASGCHAEAFAKKDAPVCSTCHLGSEPWLDQHVDRPPRGLGDFGVRFDHAGHDLGAERTCKSCHDRDPDDAATGLGRKHESCAGAACHDSAEPRMAACDGCHQPGARARRRAAAVGRPWSVRQTFRHRQHRFTDGGAALRCDACHAPPSRPGALRPPPKARCLGCHDGKRAFKATGHGCIRCHGR